MNASADLLEFERRVRAAANAADVVVASGASAAAADGLVTVASIARDIASSNSSSRSSSGSSLMDAAAAVNCTAGSCKEEQVWKHLQQQHEWPDGQLVFESLFHPCETLSPGSCVEMCGHD
jgi:hypothetical protein